MSREPGAGGRPEGLPPSYPFKPDWEVTPRQVQAGLKAGAFRGPDGSVLLDCRRDDEWALVRLPDAVHIPMNEVERRADELESEDGRRDRPIVVYCHHGRRSLQVTATLRGLGFTDVRSMAGGIDLWSVDIDAAVPRY